MEKLPSLIDQNAKYHLYNTLQKCHTNRVNIYTYALNIGVLVGFVLIFGLALYYSYKNKLTPIQIQQKMLKDQQYILSKIKYYKNEHENKKVSDITNLPMVQNSSVY